MMLEMFYKLLTCISLVQITKKIVEMLLIYLTIILSLQSFLNYFVEIYIYSKMFVIFIFRLNLLFEWMLRLTAIF